MAEKCPNLLEENLFEEVFFTCNISKELKDTNFCENLCLKQWDECDLIIDPNKLQYKGKWKEIIGLEHVKKKLVEKVQIPFLFPEKNVPPVTSIILFGPDGCGKSKLINVLAEESGAKQIHISLRNIESLSSQAMEAKSPTIFVLDEIDIIAPPVEQREMFLTTFRMQDPMITLMTAINDMKNSKNPVVLIGISDNPDLISPMLMKQEYISELIYVNPPDTKSRKLILKEFLKDKPVSKDIQLEELANQTKNYSIYDLSKLIKLIELNWIKKSWKAPNYEITMEDFSQGLKEMIPSITTTLTNKFENTCRKYGVFEKESTEKILSWDDLGGYDDIKEQLKNIEGIFKGNEMAYKYNLRAPKGILLFGPPGCGKTYIARILAATTLSNFQYIAAPDLLSKWLGESEHNLRDAFSLAKISAPSIMFFDQLDGLAFERSRTTDHPYLTTLISTFLQEISNLNEDDQVLVIGATNRPEDIDPAFLRPGRLDERIAIPPPDEKARVEIFKIHLRKLPVDKIDYDILAKKTKGYTCAEIEYICESTQRSVAMEAMKSKKFMKITQENLLEQIQNIKPDLSEDDIKSFEEIKERFQRRGVVSSIKKIDSISFTDIGGLDDVIDALKKSIMLRLTRPKEVQEYGLPAKLGLILFGAPGTGKSLLSKALLKESGANYFVFSAIELLNIYYHQDGRKKFHELLHDAERVAPSIIVLQNLELIPIELAVFISNEFNKVKKESAVVLICETTDLSRIGHVLQTSFEYMIPIYPPNLDQRIHIIKTMQQSFPTEKNLNYQELATKSENFVGADFLEVFRKAAQDALARKVSGDPKKLITNEDLLKMIKNRKPMISQAYMNAFKKQLDNFGAKKPSEITLKKTDSTLYS